MTVSMQVSKRIYAGNGVTRQWDVDFPLASPQDVRVYITSPAGAETELSADFELNAAGTELVYPTLSSGKPPLAAGWSLTLERHTPLTQEIDLLRQGELDAEVLESGYDKLTLLVQELNEKVSRSIKYPVSTTVADLETDGFLRNILSIKQDALNASSAAVSSAQQAQASASTAQQTAQSALEVISAAKTSAQNEITATGAAVENTLQTYVSAAEEEAETARYYAERSIGKTVGEVYYSQSAAEADNPGALPLFTGETIANANTLYPDFYAWVQGRPSLTCTSAEYDSALAAYGECPYYVLDAVAGSMRLPLLKNYIKAANPTDGITQKKAGLPNITGTVRMATYAGSFSDNVDDYTGAFEQNSTTDSLTSTGGNAYTHGIHPFVNFNASKANASYGASDTVTPAHTTLYPWVFAFTAAVPASTAQTAQFQGALSGKVDLPSGKTQADIDFVVESYSDANGNWYRRYKSGWLEQGGRVNITGDGTYTFLQPYGSHMLVTLNCIRLTINYISAMTNARIVAVEGSPCTQFAISSGTAQNEDFYWQAAGQGA